MKPLIPQTVYVETIVYVNNGTECSEVEKREIFLKKENQYILTKEELTELLGLAYDAVMSRKIGYDHEGFPRGVGFTKEQFINNLLNQQ